MQLVNNRPLNLKIIKALDVMLAALHMLLHVSKIVYTDQFQYMHMQWRNICHVNIAFSVIHLYGITHLHPESRAVSPRTLVETGALFFP